MSLYVPSDDLLPHPAYTSYLHLDTPPSTPPSSPPPQTTSSVFTLPRATLPLQLIRAYHASSSSLLDWEAHELSARVPPGLDGYFAWLAQGVANGDLELVTKYAASRAAKPLDQPHVLSDEGVELVLGASLPVAGGAFGLVFVSRWRGARVFVKQQSSTSQFCIEVAVLSTASDCALPTPRLLALHQAAGRSSASTSTTTILELSAGQPAHVYFSAAAQSLACKLRAAMMFAFSVQCCHAHRIIHSDVALRNFLTDGTRVFDIVDFGLAVVGDGQLGHGQAVPYPHQVLAIRQAAPEHLATRMVSPATDVWQLGLLLVDLFQGPDGTSLPRFVQEHVCPPQRQRDEEPGAFQAAMREYVSSTLPNIRDLVDTTDMPEEVVALIRACLAPDPADRPTAQDVVRALAELVDEPALTSIITTSSDLAEASLRALDTDAPLPHPSKLLSAAVWEQLAGLRDGSSDTVQLRGRASPQVLAYVVEQMTNAHSVTSLNLLENDVDDALVQALSTSLASNASLLKLELDFNQIGPDGAEAISCILASTVLQQLGLSHNAIGDRGAAAVAQSLPASTHLRTLYLDANGITSVGAVSIFDAIAASQISELWITENAIDDEAAATIADCLAKSRSLTKVYLNNNPLTDAGVAVICAGLASNTTLTHLHFYHEDLTPPTNCDARVSFEF